MGPTRTAALTVRPETLPPEPAQFTERSRLVVRAPHAAPCTVLSPQVDAHGTMAVNGGLGVPTAFETQLFKGKMQVVFKLPPDLQAEGAANLLHGKKRQIWVMLQGHFKRPVCLDDAQCGSWFRRPLRLPASFIVAPAVEWLASRLGSGLEIQLTGENPHISGPLCAACQLLNVSRPGQEPTLFAATEDTRLLFGPEAEQGEPLTVSKRKAFFRRAANRAGRMWLPDHVITMYVFDHSFDYHTFQMAVPPCFHIDMVHTMDAQPVEVSLRLKSTGEWAFRFEVWHRRMLDHLQQRQDRIRQQEDRTAQRLVAAAAAGCGLKDRQQQEQEKEHEEEEDTVQWREGADAAAEACCKAGLVVVEGKQWFN